MTSYEERDTAARKRDKWHIEKLAAEGVAVGQCFKRWINQADRHCIVIAIKGTTHYAYEYEMPGTSSGIEGQVFTRIGNTKTGKERPVSERALPPWARIRRNLDRAVERQAHE